MYIYEGSREVTFSVLLCLSITSSLFEEIVGLVREITVRGNFPLP